VTTGSMVVDSAEAMDFTAAADCTVVAGSMAVAQFAAVADSTVVVHAAAVDFMAVAVMAEATGKSGFFA